MRLPKIFIFAGLIGLLTVNAPFALSQGHRDFPSMSIEEIENLDKKTKKKIPAILLFQKIMKEKEKDPEKSLNLMIFFSLKSLFYEIDLKNIELGVKKFQKAIKENETGTLTLGQLDELIKRVARVRDTKVLASALEPKIFMSGGIALVDGTWVIEDEKIASPINHSMIRCYKRYRECFIATSRITIPNINSSEGSYYLNASWENYDIIKWDKNEIVSQSESRCRITQLFLNIKSNEVLEITRNNNQKGCDFGFVKFPKLKKPRIARLVNGFNVSWKFFQERQKEISKYYSKDMRDIIKQMGNAFKK